MNTTSQKASHTTRAALAGWSQRFDAFWSARNARERKLLGIGSLVVIGGLFYGLLLDPAVSGRAQMQKQLPALREQAAERHWRAKLAR